MTIKSSCLYSPISFLIFCLLVLHVVERGVLKSLTVTMDLSISLCSYMIFQSSIISYQYIDV